MASLSSDELKGEIQAIKDSIIAHEQQIKLHEARVKVEQFLQELIEKELTNLIRLSRNRKV